MPIGADREDQDQRDRDVRDHAVDLDAADLPARSERDHRERRQRGEGGDARREDVEDVDGGAGEEALLPDQLHQVGDRLQEPERAGPVRAVAELHPAHHLALGQRQVREGGHDEVDDDHALDHGDPPGLVHVAFTTSTSRWSSPACSSAIRAVPAASARLTRARSATRRAVRADADLVAGRDLAALRVVVGELDLRLRAAGTGARGRARRPGRRRAAGSAAGAACRGSAPAARPRRRGQARTAAGSGATYGARSGSGARSPTAPNGIPP